MRKKSLRKRSLRKKSLRKRSLRKRSLRNNDNGGSFSKDTTKDVESLRHEPVMSSLNVEHPIFKDVWGNETIKQKYMNSMAMHDIEPFHGRYSELIFNESQSKSINKTDFLISAKNYFIVAKNNLLQDLNNLINEEFKEEDKLQFYKDYIYVEKTNLINSFIEKLSS